MTIESFGVMGKILWVDLTTKKFIEEVVPEEIYRNYLGGYGLGVYFIYTRIKPKCDPLGPENILGFCPGLFTGTVAPFTGRWMVCGKSPLTGKGPTNNGQYCNGGWGDANAGGYFGPAIKRAGYDAIFFTGIADKPVYLYIDANIKELKDASDLWGKNSLDTENILKNRHGKGVQIASIGRAGENCSLIAGIVNDKGRIAARSGLGAVMGSKRLKALCLTGARTIKICQKDTAIALAKKYREMLEGYFKSFVAKTMVETSPNLAGTLRRMNLSFGKLGKFILPMIHGHYLHGYGTSYFTGISAETGDMPIKNYFGVGYLDYPQKIVRNFTGHSLIKYKVKPYGCFGCPIACGAILKVPELNLEETHRPEYETIAAFGGLILNPDIKVVFELNEFLNREGMDSISAGGVLAFVLECVGKGILHQEDFKCQSHPEGFLPQWNESGYIMPLLQMMVTREGIGDVLADGTWVAAKKIGKGCEIFAINSNGQEPAMHDQRLMTSLSLTYLADPTPGRHTAASIDFELMSPWVFLKGMKVSNSNDPLKKARKQAQVTKFMQIFNALGFCKFSIWQGTYPLIEMFKAILNWDMTIDELLTIGWRIQTLRQLFNAREGAIRHEIPKRAIGDPPLEKGPLRGVTIPVEEMCQEYYKAMGFQVDGVPQKEILAQLGLNFAINDLKISTGRFKPLINTSIAEKKRIIMTPDVQSQFKGKQVIHVNMAGSFDGKLLSETCDFEFPEVPTLLMVFEKLNAQYQTKVFCTKSIHDGLLAVLVNGQRIDAKKLPKTKIYAPDIITIVQPMVGG